MRTQVTAGALALGLSIGAFAGTPDSDVKTELQALKARIEQQDREIQNLRSASGDSWLNERRSEEIKTLIHEVLADAETRASLSEHGLTAGWRDNFFLASEDGNFLLRISGQSQTRYIYNHGHEVDREFGAFSESDEDFDGSFDDAGSDDEVEGFQQRRTKIRFDGHLFDPKFTYAVQLNAAFSGGLVAEDNFGNSRDDVGGSVYLEDAWAAYEVADGWRLRLGQFKAPFSRDELVDSRHQLAIERAYVTDYFTVDRTQGIELAYDGSLVDTPVRAAVMIHDGSYAANTDFHNDVSDFAIAARGEVLLAGTWEQFDDYTTWSGDSFGLMIGAAIDYENGERGALFGGTNNFDILKWTVDGSLEVPDAWGFNATVAFTGQHLDANFSSAPGSAADLANSADQYGLLLQAGVFVIPDKWDLLVRWEWLDYDNVFFINADTSGGFAHHLHGLTGVDESDEVNFLTFGTNYYFKKHAAKASVDLVWLLDSLIHEPNTGAGVTEDFDNDQITLRAQFQFLF